jgi:hypothetical protein
MGHKCALCELSSEEDVLHQVSVWYTDEDVYFCKDCLKSMMAFYKEEMVKTMITAVKREGGYKPNRILCESDKQFEEEKVRYRVCQLLARRLRAILHS